MGKKPELPKIIEFLRGAIRLDSSAEAVFECLVREFRKVVDFDQLSLDWVEGETATIGAFFSAVETELAAGHTYPVKGSATGWVVEHKETLIKVKTGRRPLFFGAGAGSVGLARSSILLPLFFQEDVLGVIRFSSTRANTYGTKERQMLEQVFSQIGGAIVGLRVRGEDRYAKLEKEQKERSLLINTLAHELKTPLTAIMASGGLLLDEIEDAAESPRRRLAENIVSAANKLETRLSELLDMVKSEKVGFRLDLNLLDIRPLLENLANDFLPIVARRGQTLTWDMPPSVPLVRADRQRLEQVVLNLLSNANKFTPQGGKIRLELRNEITKLVVKVKDNGPGIATEEQARIFTPYYRIEADRDRLAGLGLGLALSKQLVELHGGRIWVESTPGEGSTFAFSLPVAKPGEKDLLS